MMYIFCSLRKFLNFKLKKIETETDETKKKTRRKKEEEEEVTQLTKLELLYYSPQRKRK